MNCNPIPYLMRRLEERSTQVAIMAGIAAASGMPAPWSYYSIAACVVFALVPDKAGRGDDV